MSRTIPSYITLPLLLTLTIPAVAQRGPSPYYYDDTNNVPNSPEIHADRTVTIRLFAPKAFEVILVGSPGILEFTKKPVPLQKDEKGRLEHHNRAAAARLLHLRLRDRRRFAHARSRQSRPRSAPMGRH